MLTSLSISSKKYDEIAARVRESFPNSCILWVDEVNNPDLELAHNELFEKIKEKCKEKSKEACQQELFHGTTENAALSICREGFKSSYNITSAYGKGTYFAKNASYSIGYSCKNAGHMEIVYMLLCSVIVGTKVCGYSSAVTEDFDVTMVDNIEKPTIFVCPQDAGGIPKYMIAFHKNPVL
uniref:PARP catalytic domain-containing protein n=1 Tax=viral metagenome TaxID=1070528 RepID=A0A6C0I016_9ZZZZ